jgi:hypothetical protein
VAPLDPDHLFKQALKLRGAAAGRPRPADLRRAISAAYYGLFCAAQTAAADLFVGAKKQSTGRYELVYRSVDHKWLRELCKGVTRQPLPNKYKLYAPASGFGSDITAFAEAVVQLQEERLAADYDPLAYVTRSETVTLVAAAQDAFARFRDAPAEERAAFLTLLLFKPRN